MAPPFTLSQLLPGQAATIGFIDAELELADRMAALGLRHGRRIAVVRCVRSHGPMQIRVGTTDVIIRRSEAARIQVAPQD